MGGSKPHSYFTPLVGPHKSTFGSLNGSTRYFAELSILIRSKKNFWSNYYDYGGGGPLVFFGFFRRTMGGVVCRPKGDYGGGWFVARRATMGGDFGKKSAPKAPIFLRRRRKGGEAAQKRALS